jgi:hypothetical protein
VNSLEDKAAKTLQGLFVRRLEVIWHENRTSYLSCKKEKEKITLRLHRLFAKAPFATFEAISLYLTKGDRKAASLIRREVYHYFSDVKEPPVALETVGKVYDLEEIYKKVKSRYFSSDLHVSIGWAKRAKIGKFRSITFGTYDRMRNQVQLHPLLDQQGVPAYFVEFIVYHEVLHAVCPPKIDKRGQIRVHTSEFRRLEKEYAWYEAAKEWEKKSLLFFRKVLG